VKNFNKQSPGDGEVKKAIVIYHTLFGNTEKIAEAVASGMDEQGIDVDCAKVEDVQTGKLMKYNLLAIGGPTHGFGMSRPMKAFIKKLEHVDLRDKKAFAFDTKRGYPLSGSAAKGIEKRLKRIGMSIVRSRSSAIVKDLKGPLDENMEEIFRNIGVEIAKFL
jgi:flavorubredoxin